MLFLAVGPGGSGELPFFMPGALAGAYQMASSQWVDWKDGCYAKEMRIATLYEQATFQYWTAMLVLAPIGLAVAVRSTSVGDQENPEKNPELVAFKNRVSAKIAIVLGLTVCWFWTGIGFVAWFYAKDEQKASQSGIQKAEQVQVRGGVREISQKPVPATIFGDLVFGWSFMLFLQLCVAWSGVVQLVWGPVTVERVAAAAENVGADDLNRRLIA
eukprot:TRINITY_DN68998_c0_g1_i1.p1 TRINITY_DN68998_c0_g1~~TRINITY_DN68998_c0_g1_i1.p1  ORF type:complete len:246 (-),score=28.61 TRINITY_DN68998_c0_g1_i1:10-654(-)